MHRVRKPGGGWEKGTLVHPCTDLVEHNHLVHLPQEVIDVLAVLADPEVPLQVPHLAHRILSHADAARMEEVVADSAARPRERDRHKILEGPTSSAAGRTYHWSMAP